MSGQSSGRELPAPCRAVISLAERGADGLQSSALAPEVVGWLSSPDQGVMFEADHVLGAPELSLGPCAVEVLGSVLDGRCWWAELTLHGEREPETCLVQFTLDRADRVTELVWLRAGSVPGGGRGDGEFSLDARQALEAYFGDLQAARFEPAADRFGSDGIYSHPPYRPGGDRVLWHGRDAIRDGFTYVRGESPVRQVITDAAQSGSRAFIRGVVEGVPTGGGGTFVSTAEFSESGDIARYVALYSAARF
jgi:SnoaL-like domain